VPRLSVRAAGRGAGGADGTLDEATRHGPIREVTHGAALLHQIQKSIGALAHFVLRALLEIERNGRVNVFVRHNWFQVDRFAGYKF
jgi:hypothetical protein